MHDAEWQNATYAMLANFRLVSVLKDLEITYERADLRMQSIKFLLSVKCGRPLMSYDIALRQVVDRIGYCLKIAISVLGMVQYLWLTWNRSISQPGSLEVSNSSIHDTTHHHCRSPVVRRRKRQALSILPV
jgi:hypothetical protein